MARGRMIAKSFSTSAKRDALMRACPRLAEFAEFLFVLLVVHADDHGRLPGDEFTVKVQVDPVSRRKPADFVAALHVLHEVGLIRWYQVEGKKLIEIVGFAAHQDLRGHNLRPGKLPACPGECAFIGRKSPMGESSPKPALSKSKLSESNLNQEVISPEPLSRSEPAVLTFPTIGTKGTEWDLTNQQIAEWQVVYPSMDILAEARKALAWVRAQPGRRKTASGMLRFLVGWFNRTNDRGKGAAVTAGPVSHASTVGKRSVVPSDERL